MGGQKMQLILLIKYNSIIIQLIQRKPINRLGFNGDWEIKDHPWLKNFNWDDLLNKKIKPPFRPTQLDNFDKKYCDSADKIGMETIERYQCYYKCENYKSVFVNYTFINDDNELDAFSKKYTLKHLNFKQTNKKKLSSTKSESNISVSNDSSS